MSVSSEINDCTFTVLTLDRSLQACLHANTWTRPSFPFFYRSALTGNGRFGYSMLLPSCRLSFSLQVVVLPLQVVEPLQVFVLLQVGVPLQVVLPLQVVHLLQVVILCNKVRFFRYRLSFFRNIVVLPLV